MLGTFDYVRPRSVEEACRLLKEAPNSSSILAGGTDLLVQLRDHLHSPDLLVDIKGISELSTFDAAATGETRIGANVPLNVVVENHAIRERFQALADAAASIGTYQLRNRGTLAGNLCNASPAADGAPPLLVLNAHVEIASPEAGGHRRLLPVSNLFAGVKRTTLESDEIVTQIRIPDHPSSLRTAFAKQQRIKGHDLAVVNVAGAYNPQSRTIRIAIGSCSPTPVLLEAIDTSSGDLNAIRAQATALAAAATAPISDVRASASYRLAVLPVLIHRILDRLLNPRGGN